MMFQASIALRFDWQEEDEDWEEEEDW